MLGLGYFYAEDWEAAATMYAEAAEQFRSIGQLELTHNSWGMLAVVYLKRGEPAEARRLLEARLAYRGTVIPLAIAFTKRWLALALIRLDELAKARDHLQRALQMSWEQRIQARQTVDAIKISIEYLLCTDQPALAARAVNTLVHSAELGPYQRRVDSALLNQIPDEMLTSAGAAEDIFVLSAEIATHLSTEVTIDQRQQATDG